MPGASWIGTPGPLPTELAAAGIEPDEIDLVVLTHLHLDHIGWNLAWDGDRPRPRFPRARYLVQRADWELFATRGDEDDREASDRCAGPGGGRWSGSRPRPCGWPRPTSPSLRHRGPGSRAAAAGGAAPSMQLCMPTGSRGGPTWPR